ncbi:TORTIFOLIA1-like protein 2 [Musa acuminata AAA Group]|uniref:TORTIFOLIA1-like protein 2 n=1 Tax=Musa acuminata AAA Group TaxID=214697 RepID=UPI0031CDCAEC
MKPRVVAHSKARSGGKAAVPQQAVFEMKQRVILSLNKLADRDTYNIGVEELEKAALKLPPDMIAPFLSCVAETNAEQKSAVRAECVRLMGTLARSHGILLAPYLGKVVGSIVKRLKDTDSVVRDACVEACGVLATSIRGGEGGGGATFVALAKPLFEALGEQNRYVQVGAAHCLARVIDEASDAPQNILPQMLTRVIKLLKNQHFMAKPAIIELIRSIIQAGCALAEHTLSAAVTSILEALKSNDWTTRKAASVALAGIAVNPGSSLAPLRSSCLHFLESCRFDKVKPARDSIMHAIQCWRALPVTHSSETSEAGSSTKENFGKDINVVTGVCNSRWRDTLSRKNGPVSDLCGNSTSTTQKRAPLSVRKPCTTNMQSHQRMKSNDWHIAISIPKTHGTPLVNSNSVKSDSNVIDLLERRMLNTAELQNINFDYGSVFDKPECSSVSVPDYRIYEMEHLTVSHDCDGENDSEGNDSISPTRNNHSAIEDNGRECLGTQERKSPESTISDLCSRSMHGCCVHAANGLAAIKQQLLEIETKQSNLLDLLQVFIRNSIDNVSKLQSKVNFLEQTLDKMTHSVAECENYSSMVCSKILKKVQTVSSSPKLTPRPSVDNNYNDSSLLSSKSMEIWQDNLSSKSRSSTSVIEEGEILEDSSLDILQSPIPRGVGNNSGRILISLRNQERDVKDASVGASNLKDVNGYLKRIKEFLSAGNLESAYVEAILSGDDRSLVLLMDRTGPVLDKLSHETTNEVLYIMATNFVNRRYLEGAIPWLQQVVNLTMANEPRNLFLSTKAQMDFLLALQVAATRGCADPVAKTSISRLAVKLSKLWHGDPSRKGLPPRGSQGNKKCAF